MIGRRIERPQPSLPGSLGRWLVPLLLILVAAGCSTGRLTEFQQFAAIGTSYTRAVDGALIRTGRLAIQANSIELIENRELAAVSREALQDQDQVLKEFLEELVLLRQQVLALNDYFQALAALSGSKAPEQFAAGLNQSAGALAGISQTLGARMGSGGGRLAPLASATAGAGELYVAKRRMKLLEAELEQRDQVIAEILVLQEQLLGLLSGIAEEDQSFVAQRGYEWSVAGPFAGTDPLACADLWMADREAALLASPLTAQLALTTEATRQLRSAWGKLLSREFGPLDLSVLAKSVNDALAGPVGIPAPEPTVCRSLCPPAP
ncbi:MAG: hypothetical protein GY856_08860 [bacterium]|nr:hypothetical protein [bacterium]